MVFLVLANDYRQSQLGYCNSDYGKWMKVGVGRSMLGTKSADWEPLSIINPIHGQSFILIVWKIDA